MEFVPRDYAGRELMASEARRFGDVLRAHRIALGLTQEALAERSGLSVRGLSDLERGLRLSPHPDSVRRLADALGLDGDDRARFNAVARRAHESRQVAARELDSPTAASVHAPKPAGETPRSARNFPTQLTSFVGHEYERIQLQSLLATTRLLTLVGAGGSGKTRLALEVASSAADQFAEGAFLVELAPLVDGMLVPQQVASALRLGDVPGESVTRTLVAALRGRELLLILDNCEHVLESSKDLVAALLEACPEVRILATSRSVLGLVGETVRRVPSLSLPQQQHAIRALGLERSEAAQLFVDRAVAAAPGFSLTDQNAQAIARVCVTLDGIPLALELAAARIRTMGVAELAQRLDDCFRDLTGGGPNRPERHQTLKAAVDWSYALLGPFEQEVFASLSVFRGGFTLEAVETVCGPGSETIEGLQHLADQSLVIAEPCPDGAMRYRVLEPLRQYAAECLEAAHRTEDMRRRHADYMRSALPRRWNPVWWGPRLAEREQWVEQELDNLRAALRWLLDDQDPELAMSLAYPMGPFWLMTNRVREGRALLEALAAAIPADGEPSATRAGVLVWLGALATEDGDHSAGRAFLERGVAMARACEDSLALAYGLMWSAIHWALRQQPVRARAFAVEGLSVSRPAGYRALEALNLRVLAQIAIEMGELDEAVRLAQEALAAGREAEHPPSLVWALNALGLIRFRQGKLEAARSFLEQSLANELGSVTAAIHQSTLVYLAWISLEQGNLAQASARAMEALRIGHELLGGRAALALPLEAFAQIAVAGGQTKHALRLAGAATVCRESGTVAMSPSVRQQLERWLSAARAALGESVANAEYVAGQSLSTEQAIASAVALADSVAASAPSKSGQREGAA